MPPPTFWHSFADCRYDWGNSADRIYQLGDCHYDAVEVVIHGWNFVRCSRCSVHHDGIVIAADGACRANGSADARAAVGVYVGDGSAYNFRACLHHDYFRYAAAPATNQRAELLAGIRAL
jgi:ribonuclease HI